jgi:hypothetical protein
MEPTFNPEQFAPPPPVEVPKIPETPEISAEAKIEAEVAPEQFDNMAQAAEQEIQTDQEQVFKSADGRVAYAKELVKLDSEQAADVFQRGGFSDRISGMKEKISGLIQGTKQRIQSLRTGGNGELEIPKLEPLKIEPKKMISNEKGFEPNRMIKRHNLFMSVSPEDRRARVDEFKENLMEQKEGLVAVQGEIVRMIRENPNIEIEEIKTTVGSQLEAINANPDQRKALEKVLSDYSEAHKAVHQHRERIPDDRRLFMEVFNF